MDKAARLVAPGEPVELVGPPPRFVSRGGDKLSGALTGFALDVAGARCLDAGASTGGFTDCLLQHGASAVVAVDVGHGQLHPRMRADPRVEVHERLHVRDMPLEWAGSFSVVVADLSFISMASVARHLVPMAVPDGDLVVLVKPQFEAGKAEVNRGRGVIKDPEVQLAALERACSALEESGAGIIGHMTSPIRGADGNVEFLVHARRIV